ncbi:Bax inhibitor-1/YccA family protein [Candidatus Saccharibacteria bacterium]|nr:Bax inhibitor-1/YccA family protein [Candidatus Saccharibacteria bacterium]
MEKSGNPAFSRLNVTDKAAAGGKTMTEAGTYVKTLLLFVVVIIAAALSWQYVSSAAAGSAIRWLPLWIVSLSTFFLGLTISFNPKLARPLSLVYAVLQGGLLGIISGMFATVYEGIVGQAVFTTLAVFSAVFLGYSLGFLKASGKFARIIITAMLGLVMFELLSWVFSLFSQSTPLVFGYSNYAIIFGVAIVIVAALSLVLDFDFIARASKEKLPKYYEWYGAYGLMVGLIWLYLEILRLLARMAARSQR